MNCKILFIGSEFIFSQRAIDSRGDKINSDPFNNLNNLNFYHTNKYFTR